MADVFISYSRQDAVAAEVTGRRVGELQAAVGNRSSLRPYSPSLLRAWDTVKGLDLDALYVGCLMDGPGTRRPLRLR